MVSGVSGLQTKRPLTSGNMIKKTLFLKLSTLLGCVLCLRVCVVPTQAYAHVKWFAPYDVAQAPIRLTGVLNLWFVELLVLTLVLLWTFCMLERTAVGTTLLASVDEVFSLLRGKTDTLMRAGTGAFFVAIWAHGGIILTPELFTTSPWTEWLQLAIAIGLVFRVTMPLSALGMVFLFAQGIWSYGLFHMMDYPIFLGDAVFLTMSGFRLTSLLGVRAVDIIRIGASITLLWASIEKWAYPEWTYPILYAHQDLAMGLDPHFYMIAAGMVEFGLAFALLWTPLVRRMAAVVLMSMFVSAVFEFGKIDAIGHSVIVIILLVVAADNGRATQRAPALAPFCLSVALAVTMLLYYGGHALLFGTRLV
jgi:hypothetical protein